MNIWKLRSLMQTTELRFKFFTIENNEFCFVYENNAEYKPNAVASVMNCSGMPVIPGKVVIFATDGDFVAEMSDEQVSLIKSRIRDGHDAKGFLTKYIVL